MEAAHAEYVAARAAHAALAERGDDARHARDLSRDRIARAAAETAANVPRLLAEVARQREEIARLTAALDGVRREERARCKRECMVIAGELSYDFRLRLAMHAAERCAKAIGALPDDATGSAT